jgi:hypothetical protein
MLRRRLAQAASSDSTKAPAGVVTSWRTCSTMIVAWLFRAHLTRFDAGRGANDEYLEFEPRSNPMADAPQGKASEVRAAPGPDVRQVYPGLSSRPCDHGGYSSAAPGQADLAAAVDPFCLQALLHAQQHLPEFTVARVLTYPMDVQDVDVGPQVAAVRTALRGVDGSAGTDSRRVVAEGVSGLVPEAIAEWGSDRRASAQEAGVHGVEGRQYVGGMEQHLSRLGLSRAALEAAILADLQGVEGLEETAELIASAVADAMEANNDEILRQLRDLLASEAGRRRRSPLASVRPHQL